MTRRFAVSLLFLLALAPLGCSQAPAGPRFEVLEVEGKTLRGNPLGDPVARRVAIFAPPESGAGKPLPVVYYLPGYGGSSAEQISAGARSPFAAVVAQLAADGLPLVIAIPDGRNRFGGSQYLNSAAQGNYADYIAQEVVAAVEAKHPAAKGRRIAAGHSSGGYGALMLGMARQEIFPLVVALAPDSDFEVTHRPVVQQPSVRRVTATEAAAFAAPKNAPRPRDGLVELVLGLSVAYAPLGPTEPGRFRWLYDDAGAFQPQVWQQWLDLDPLVIVRKNPRAFASSQRVYLDGADRDEWGFNASARKVHDVIRERGGTEVTFHEPRGGHSDAIPERLIRGLRWALGQPVQ